MMGVQHLCYPFTCLSSRCLSFYSQHCKYASLIFAVTVQCLPRINDPLIVIRRSFFIYLFLVDDYHAKLEQN